MRKHTGKGTALRILTLFLAILMAMPFIAACNDEENKPDDTTPENVISDTSAITGIPADFDYGGDTFTICTVSRGWIADDIWVEENTALAGEPIYDAIIKRNLIMLEKYGADIQIVTGEPSDDANYSYKFITNSLRAGDGMFDVISTNGREALTFAKEGLLWDLNEIETMNLSNSWLDQKAVEQLSISNKLYFAVGEYTASDNRATHAIAFNKQMIEEYDSVFGPMLGDRSLYQCVQDGDWTLDLMLDMSKVVTQDLDGNSKMDAGDRYGFSCFQTSIYAFLQSCGITVGGQNPANELVEITFYSDKTTTLWEKLIDNSMSNYIINRYALGQQNIDIGQDQFANDQILFYGGYIKDIMDMRSISYDFEFGILPYPKYDAEQEEYISAAHEYGTPFLCVPTTNVETDDIGYLLEALNFESVDTLTYAFYDKTLVGRTSRDNESEPMLELIFSTKSYDWGILCNWGDFSERMMTAWNEQNRNISSLYNALARKMKHQVETEMEFFGIEA